MATKAKRSASAPRHPEKKWGPFHVGPHYWVHARITVVMDAGYGFDSVGQQQQSAAMRAVVRQDELPADIPLFLPAKVVTGHP